MKLAIRSSALSCLQIGRVRLHSDWEARRLTASASVQPGDQRDNDDGDPLLSCCIGQVDLKIACRVATINDMLS